jgi:alkanesulfonate monooxygenase SsuD/methylene tetrahydromethanopterin reductase-like flavin-dependent oxidoreductase (luciferase family)
LLEWQPKIWAFIKWIAVLSLNRLTNDRFILGLGSGDREAEFAAFGHDAAQRAEVFR